MPTLRVAIAADRAVRGGQRYERAARGVEQASGRVDRAVRGVDRSMDRVGRTSGAVAGRIRALVAAFVGFHTIRQVTRTIGQFEETMFTVQGVTRASAEQMRRLTEAARTMGATTRFTASQAGEGLLFLARAGFDANAAIEALPATLDLAVAGQLQLGEAADFASNVVSQFGLTAAETTRVVDTMTAVSNRSNTNVQQLAEALKFAGSVAGAMGQDVEDTAAAIGVLGDRGIQATLAGTNLRGVMLALLGPSSEARSEFERLGLTLQDIDPQRHGLIEVFRRLGEAQLSAAQASLIFGRRNAGAALILSRNADAVASLAEQTREAGGETQRLSRLMDQSLAGSARSLTSAFEALILKTGDDGLTGTLRGVIDTTTEALRVLAGVTPAEKEVSTEARVLAGSIEFLARAGAVLVGIKILRWFRDAIAGAGGLRLALAAHPLLTLAGIVGTVGAAFSTLASQMRAAQEAADALKLSTAGLDKVMEGFQSFRSQQAGALEGGDPGLYRATLESRRGALAQTSFDPGDFYYARDVASATGQSISSLLRRAGPGQISFPDSFLNAQLQDRLSAISRLPQRLGDQAFEELLPELLAEGPAIRGDYAAKVADRIVQDLTEELEGRAPSFLEMLEREATSAGAPGIPAYGTRAPQSAAEALGPPRPPIPEPTQLDRFFEQLQFEASLIGKTNQEREVAIALREAENAALAEGRDLYSEERIAIEGSVKAIVQANQALSDHNEQQQFLQQTFGNVLFDLLDGIAVRGEKASAVIAGLVQNLSRLFLSRATSALAADLFPTESALGNVFADGRVVPFARGGALIPSTTFFPLRGGNLGVAGEEGAEAIFPLRRTPSGRLGIEATGGGRPIALTMNYYGSGSREDRDAFRRSGTQMVRQLERLMRRSRLGVS